MSDKFSSWSAHTTNGISDATDKKKVSHKTSNFKNNLNAGMVLFCYWDPKTIW